MTKHHAVTTDLASSPPPASPASLRVQFERLDALKQSLLADQRRYDKRLAELTDYLGIAPAVGEALEKLGEELFGKLAKVIESNLTLALQEVLGQPISLRVKQDYKRGGATLRLHVERDGHPEDIIRGTGGSVANILSVGLRIFALSQLDPKKHRRFLVLDEQDCWLAPDLVPRLVKIVRDAGKSLGFQVIMISHHDSAMFERYADRIYRFIPKPEGVEVEEILPMSAARDPK